MTARLPAWVETGGVALAFIAGSVNAVGFLGFQHQAVSHLTGSSTVLSTALAQGNWLLSWHLLWILLSFVLGAVVSGLIIRDAHLRLGRRYGVALLLESALLLTAMVLLNRGSDSGHYLASAACGLQNAMASTYSGAVIRTTHVSGMFTDLGIYLGQALRGIAVEGRRVKLYLFLIGGFLAGGAVGATAYLKWSYSALWVPSALTLSLAGVYWLYRHRQLSNAS
ncbi:MAG TPA: YoaK family protein [Permianibacter sp.]|nr:YoaK family protein [Permianibacter sp.]